jgi:hypothetical protein
MRAGDFSRRRFLQRAGNLGLATALAELPALLEARGLLEQALGQSPDTITGTFSGLVAMVLPGDDAAASDQTGTAHALIDALDGYVPEGTAVAGGRSLAASAAVAKLLNDYALQVNPVAARGRFAAPFARLTLAEKGEVFRRFESDPELADSEVRFVAGILPGFAAFLAFSEAGV